MQAALARKPEESRSHAAPEPLEAGPELAAETAGGALAGTPLFLRRFGEAPPSVQRQKKPEEGDEEEQNEEEPVVQAKLEVNEPGDIWEREADHVSAAVMRKEEPSTSDGSGLCPKCEEERRLHGTPSGIQRRCAECEAKLQGAEEDEEETVQRKPASSGPVPPGLSLPVPDSGSPLSGALRQRIEPVLGADLSGVRVHSSPAARESARSLKAKA
ncbi:MAG TPA: DUF4157 domain-containing protein, partial [Thermoanaerobaculia bacterium]